MSSVERGDLSDPLRRIEGKKLDPLHETRAQRQESNRPDQSALSDRIQVSSLALELRSFTERALALPEVRAERIAQIKAAINDGAFNPSSSEIARSILSRTPDQALF